MCKCEVINVCKFCERRQDVKFGWDQPPLENIHGNIVEDLEFKAVIHDYKINVIPQNMACGK